MSTYNFPNKCCVCFGSSDTSTVIHKTKSLGNQQFTFQIEVPVCFNCEKKFNRKDLIFVIIMVISGIVVALLWPNLATENGGPKYVVGGILGIILGVIIGMIYRSIVDPVMIETIYDGGGYRMNGIWFQNKEYQELFNKANRKY